MPKIPKEVIEHKLRIDLQADQAERKKIYTRET
jgi:hypothetical protein